MKSIITLIGCWAIAWPLFAQAPVVDDSDNFTVVDGQLAYDEPRNQSYDRADDVPLAKDDGTIRAQNMSMLDQVQGLQQEVKELRGQLETQAHAVEELKNQQLAFYKDLDARLAQRNSAAASSTPPATATSSISMDSASAAPKTTATINTPHAEASTGHQNPADEQIRYLAAYDLLKAKRTDDAMVAMKTFIEAYPNGAYTPNAYYWLGELNMIKAQHPAAILAFETVIRDFPTSNKAAASALKIGYALVAMGKPNEARERFQQVIADYPKTPAAQLATMRLRALSGSS